MTSRLCTRKMKSIDWQADGNAIKFNATRSCRAYGLLH